MEFWNVKYKFTIMLLTLKQISNYHNFWFFNLIWIIPEKEISYPLKNVVSNLLLNKNSKVSLVYNGSSRHCDSRSKSGGITMSGIFIFPLYWNSKQSSSFDMIYVIADPKVHAKRKIRNTNLNFDVMRITLGTLIPEFYFNLWKFAFVLILTLMARTYFLIHIYLAY